MKSSITLALLLSLSALAGCAGPVHTYPGDKKDISQVAVVKSRSKEFIGSIFPYYLNFVSYSKLEQGQKPVFESVGNEITGYPFELRMLPGKYLVMIRCSTRNLYAFPSFTFEAEAGAMYEVICEPVADQLSKVKAIVEKVEAQLQK